MTLQAPLALASITVAFLGIWTIAMIAGHFQKNGLNPYNFAVSEYGRVPGSKNFIAVCWWSAALCGASLCCSLATFISQSNVAFNRNAVTVIVCLAIYGPARILTWMFPCKLHRPMQNDNSASDSQDVNHSPSMGFPQDNQSSKEDLNHKLHILFAFISFASIAIAACAISGATSSLPGTALSKNGPALSGIGYAIVGSLLLSRILRGADLFGVGERVFYVLQMLWFGWTAVVTIIDSS